MIGHGFQKHWGISDDCPTGVRKEIDQCR